MNSGIGDFTKKQTETLEKNLSLLQEKLPALIDRLQNSQIQNEDSMKKIINNMVSSQTDSQKQVQRVHA